MKKFEIISGVLSVIFILWLFLSFVEVISKNLNPQAQYCSLNCWVILSDICHDFNS